MRCDSKIISSPEKLVPPSNTHASSEFSVHVLNSVGKICRVKQRLLIKGRVF